MKVNVHDTVMIKTESERWIRKKRIDILKNDIQMQKRLIRRKIRRAKEQRKEEFQGLKQDNRTQLSLQERAMTLKLESQFILLQCIFFCLF